LLEAYVEGVSVVCVYVGMGTLFGVLLFRIGWGCD